MSTHRISLAVVSAPRWQLQARLAGPLYEIIVAIMLHDVINILPHRIFWKDATGRFLGGNINFLHDLGLQDLADLIGKTDFDFFDKYQAEAFRTHDALVISSGEALLDYEEPQPQADGVHVLLTSKVPLRGSDEQIVGILGMYVDITERKAMEQAVALAQRTAEHTAQAKTEFLTHVSHELRTPLTLILGPLDTLLKEGRSDISAAVAQELSLIRRNASRLYVLVNDILDFSKIEAGKLQPLWQEVDVAALLQTLVDDAQPSATGAGTTLHLQLQGDLSAVATDRRKLEKIALNLLGNALKFTPPGGHIEVCASMGTEGLELLVRDNGAGIPEDQQQQLFTRFVQGRQGGQAAHEGTGLGLALVKQFAELLGGRAFVRSAEGAGACFYVCLPRPEGVVVTRADGEVQPVAPSYHVTASRNVRKHLNAVPGGGPGTDDGNPLPLVLVVDDTPDMRTYIMQVLQPKYRVVQAADGVQALAWLAANWQRGLPEVIVTDAMMPHMDGFEFVRQLKVCAEYKAVPVIMVTARASNEELVMGLDAGADDYLAKPFGHDELMARVNAAHRLHVTYRALQQSRERERQAQIQLLQAAKMAVVGTLVAGLSHELNNPLGAILLHTQRLARTPQMQEDGARKSLDKIEMQASRCATLVRSLLDFSRSGAAAREDVDVAALLRHAAALATTQAERHGVLLQLQIEAQDATACVCAQQIETALLNLIGNAALASAEGDIVCTTLRNASRNGQEGVCIAVEDHGSGIDEGVLPHIFDPFFTTRAPGTGTGLGLSLTLQYVQGHGGHLDVKSQKDRGTTMTVWLPKAAGGVL